MRPVGLPWASCVWNTSLGRERGARAAAGPGGSGVPGSCPTPFSMGPPSGGCRPCLPARCIPAELLNYGWGWLPAGRKAIPAPGNLSRGRGSPAGIG